MRLSSRLTAAATAILLAVTPAACSHTQPSRAPKAASIHYRPGASVPGVPKPTKPAPKPTKSAPKPAAAEPMLPNEPASATSLPRRAQVAIAWARTYYGFIASDPYGTREHALQQLSTPACYQQAVPMLVSRRMWRLTDTVRIAIVRNQQVQIRGDTVYLVVHTETYVYGRSEDRTMHEHTLELTMVPANTPMHWLVSSFQIIGPTVPGSPPSVQ
jgi:hypothetical protein